MNILFLTLAKMGDVNERGMYKDLVRQFIKYNHSITIVYPVEKKEGRQTQVRVQGKIKVIAVKAGNITKCRNMIEKGISTVLLQAHYIHAIKKYCSDNKYDLVLYATPPITFSRVIKVIKKRDNANSYLMLKDIFPQNAIDIGLLPTWGPWNLLVWLFKQKEKQLYSYSDYIGCMSPKNVSYLLEYNPQIPVEKVEVCPNSVEPLPRRNIAVNKRGKLIPLSFLYGGNLGKPQCIPFLIDCLKDNMNKADRKFIICGSGTETPLLQSFIEENKPTNITFIPGLPVDEYDKLVSECNIGMIFLDYRFTIPNFPSRVLSYMEKSLPILACTDKNTDMGEIITEGNFGWWCESKNVHDFTALIDTICSLDLDVLTRLGDNARTYLENHYTVEQSYNTIIKHFI